MSALSPEKVAEYLPLAEHCEALVQMTREDMPVMVPIIGEMCALIVALARRVAELEQAAREGESS
jgi:hypothetical protein